MTNVFMRSFQTELDPYILYTQLGLPDDSIFLDSSKKDSLYSHYSIIGLNPFLTIKVVSGQLYEKIYPNTDFSLLAEKNVFAYLNRLIAKHHIDNTTSYPFIGGGIGYFSYELGKAYQHITSSRQDLFTLPECYFVFYDNVIILDIKKQEGLITGLGKIKPGDLSTHEIQARINSMAWKPSSESSPESTIASPVFSSTFTRQAYMKAIDRMQNYMEDGHIYVANMTHTFHGPCYQAASSVYERLRRINPAPFSAYLPLDGFQLCCSSPERFIQVHNKQVQTRPIKGTVPRGETHALDQKNRKQLEQSTKDKAELLMIVDLERNDLSRVCQPHSVQVPDLFKIESFSSVYHLVSTVTGLLKDGKTSVDCLQATFPGGSITGAPKIRAMEIIEELERTSRQIYTGSVGYFGFDGNADFNIVIRSILMKDDHAYIGVGGGITYESNPAAEFQETLDKAKNLFSALNATVNIDEF